MILPATVSTVWILAIVAVLCLGSWVITLKLAGKWRFEHFYYDFVLGILLSALAAAFVLGSANSQELTFQDNMLLSGYRKMAWALGSGMLLNLGILLMLAATTLAGMSVGFPVTLGVALAIGAVWDFAGAEHANTALTFGGVTLLLAAVVVTALAYSWRLQAQQQAAQKALQPDPRLKPKRSKPPGAALAVILAVFGGIALSIFLKVLDVATSGDNGLAAYSAFLLLSISALVSSPFFVIFFTTFPVVGTSDGIRGYLAGNMKQHLLGVLGGILWGAGMLSTLLISAAPQNAQPAALYQYPLNHLLNGGALLIAAVWGLVAWRESGGAGRRVNLMLAGMFVLFLAGFALVTFAFGPK